MFDVPLDYSVMVMIVLIAAFTFRVRSRFKAVVENAIPSAINLQVIPDQRHLYAHGAIEVVPDSAHIPNHSHTDHDWVTEPPRLLYFVADAPDMLLRPDAKLFRKIVQDLQPPGWKITNISISYKKIDIVYDYTFWTRRR